MTAWLTPVVLLVAAAAVLGLILGWCISYLFAARAHNRLVEQSESRVRSVKHRLESATALNTRLTQDVERANHELAAARKQLGDESEQRNSQVRDLGELLTRKDRQREDLERQLKALEEQQLRVQRDITQFRLFKNREVEQLREQLGLSGAASSAAASASGGAISSAATGALGAGAGMAAAAMASADPEVAEANRVRPGPSAAEGASGGLPDITHVVLESEEDVLDMTSEFDFDPAQLLDDTSEQEPLSTDAMPAINLSTDKAITDSTSTGGIESPAADSNTRSPGILDRLRNRR